MLGCSQIERHYPLVNNGALVLFRSTFIELTLLHLPFSTAVSPRFILLSPGALPSAILRAIDGASDAAG